MVFLILSNKGQVPANIISSSEEAVQIYEAAHTARLGMNTSFGQDPLEGRPDLSSIRKEAFKLRFNIEVIFSGLVNETVTPFETAILFFIRETKRHINDS